MDEAVVHGVDGAVGGGRGGRRPQRGGSDPEPHFLALHISDALYPFGQGRADKFESRADGETDEENNRHRLQQRDALILFPDRLEGFGFFSERGGAIPRFGGARAVRVSVFHRLSERKAKPYGNPQQRETLQQIGKRGGIFKRIRRIYPEKAAAVGKQLFNDDLAGRGTEIKPRSFPV